jgi:hypothetical protein
VKRAALFLLAAKLSVCVGEPCPTTGPCGADWTPSSASPGSVPEGDDAGLVVDAGDVDAGEGGSP